MDVKVKVLTVLVAVLAVVALGEGVVLVHFMTREAPKAEPAAGDPAGGAGRGERVASVPAGKGGGAGERPRAPQTTGTGGQELPAKEPKPAGTAGGGEAPKAPETTARVVPAPVEAALTAEEKAAREKAADKAKMKQAIDTIMEMSMKQMLDEFDLNNAQREQAKPVVAKLRGVMTGMITEMMEQQEALKQEERDMRRSGRMTEDQIQEMIKPKQAEVMKQFQEKMSGSMQTIGATMEELRPILDQRQAALLDKRLQELKQAQGAMKEMKEGLAPKGG